MAQRQGASRHRAPDPLVPRVTRLAKASEPTLHKLVRNRRQVLIGAGAAVVATGAVGSAAAVMGGGGIGAALGDSATSTRSPRDAGAFADRDASYTQSLGDSIDLGAAGLAETPPVRRRRRGRRPPRPTPTCSAATRSCTCCGGPRFGPDPGRWSTTAGKAGIDEWLEQQLNPGKVDDPVGGQGARPRSRPSSMTTAQIRRTVKDGDWQAQYELGQATIARQIWSSRQLFEVMVDFWSNHLNVTNPFDGGWDVRTSYDNDVIRKHALGTFSDMLKASARHPAMLRYLDNAASDRRSVNENYGRELLELHTVGIDGGYIEKDVRNSAYIMTGRTVTDDGEFRYEADRHWIDPVKVLGFKDKNPSRSKGLARRRRTTCSTSPPTRRPRRTSPASWPCGSSATPRRTALVQRLAETYLENGTAIVPVLRVLFRSQEFWIATGLKTRRPLENFVATARALGVAPGADTRAGRRGPLLLTQRFGQAPLALGAAERLPGRRGGLALGARHAGHRGTRTGR